MAETRPTSSTAPPTSSTTLPASSTTSTTRRPALDAVRGTAALLVLLGHLHDLDPHSPTAGLGAFVLLFFPLSGFLIAGPFIRALVDGRSLPSIRDYALRRCARILPAYWLTLLAILVFLPTAQGLRWWELPLHLTLMQNLVPGEAGAILPVAWTLSVEAFFYIATPIAAVIVYRRLRGPIAPGALATGLLVAWALSSTWDVVLTALPAHTLSTGVAAALRYSLAGYLCTFCPGMLIALAETSRARALGGPWAWYRHLQRRPAALLPLLALAWFPLMPGVNLETVMPAVLADNLHLVGGTIGSGIVLMMMVRPNVWMARAGAVIAPIGVVSYGLYLWHWVIINLAREHAGWLVRAGWRAGLPVILVGSLAVATASWVVVERPSIDRAARLMRRRRTVELEGEPAPLRVGAAEVSSPN